VHPQGTIRLGGISGKGMKQVESGSDAETGKSSSGRSFLSDSQFEVTRTSSASSLVFRKDDLLSHVGTASDVQQQQGMQSPNIASLKSIVNARTGYRVNMKQILRELAAPILVHRKSFALGAAGSPHYLAPESVKGGRTTFSSDYYAVGVLAFRCACGKLPVDGRTTEEVLAATRDRQIAWRRLPQGMTPELLDLIYGLMEE